MKRVALFGVSTPQAIELLRVLSIHPMAELAVIADEAYAGKRLAEVYPGFSVVNTQSIIEPERALESEWDLAIVADRADYAAPIVQELETRKLRYIALSDGEFGETFGISYRREAIINEAQSVRIPSPTAQALCVLLAPIAEQGLLNGHIQAHSTFEEESSRGLESLEILKSSSVLEASTFLAGSEGEFPFELHLVTQSAPVGRGLLLTAFIELNERLTLSTLDNLYREYYDPALFISQLTTPLGVNQVLGSNRAHFFLRAAGNQLCGTVVLDVLGRGSAMQAVECANLMLGLPEEAGLLFAGHG